MKRILLFIVTILLLPISVYAEDISYITCDSNELKTGEETKCNIYFDVDYIVTNVSGKIVLDDNLELVSSSYEKEDWLMLDDEFSVESINLISETKEERDKFVIASFTVKAINKDDISSSKISFKDVVIGDENYESHEFEVEELELSLKYKSNNNIFVIMLFILLIIILFIVIKKDNDKENKKVNKKKKIKSFIILFILLLVPSYVDAANNININCGKTKLNKNEETSCTLSVTNLNFIPTDVSGSVKVGNNLSITSSSYNSGVWTSFDSSFNVKDINLIRQSKSEVSSITIAVFKVKASNNASGTSSISFNNVVMGDNNYNSVTLGSKNIGISFNSSENNLSSLSVSEGNISFFKDITTYSLNVDKDSITISATPVDSKAKVSGTGKKTLKYGNNTFNVIVTAEDGSKKTYTINVNRKDDRSTNNYLSSLSLSDGRLSFDKNTNTYNVTVDSNVSKVTISAKLDDSKAKFVNGFGPRTVNLNYGKNVVLVKVLSENEKERVYTLNITRKDDRSTDTTLKNITISSGKIDFKKDKYNYDVNVTNDVESIKINAEANDPKSKVEVNGPSTLDVGENIFIIKVTAENGSVKEYKVNVNREKKVTITDGNKIKDIEVEDYELEFYSDVYDYTLKTNESDLDIIVTLYDEDSSYVINGNENLEDGSIISIVVTDKDDNHNIYRIHIENYHEVNVLLILFIISVVLNIIFIIVILYLIIKNKKKHKKAN